MVALQLTRPTCSLANTFKDNKYLRFAERVNGRCAMQGFVWGMGEHLHSGSSFIQQMSDVNCDLKATAVVGLVALASAFTIDETEEFFMFTEDVERLNGLAAMIGFLGATLVV